MKRYKQDCLKPYIESTHETMIEHKDGGWMIYKDHIAAVDELLEIIDGQVKVIKRHQKIEAALKTIAIWALHPDEDTLKQIHHRAMEALGE